MNACGAGLRYLLLHANTSLVADLDPTRVDLILSSPRTYDGKDVTVKGIVTRGVGLMGVGGYHLRDPDGRQEIFISSRSGVPPAGTVVTIRAFTEKTES